MIRGELGSSRFRTFLQLSLFHRHTLLGNCNVIKLQHHPSMELFSISLSFIRLFSAPVSIDN